MYFQQEPTLGVPWVEGIREVLVVMEMDMEVEMEMETEEMTLVEEGTTAELQGTVATKVLAALTVQC